MEVQKALVKSGASQQGAAVITLNRPDKRNALSCALMEQLLLKLDELALDTTLRVLILRGEGPIFCAGLDLAELQDPEKAGHSATLISALFKKLYSFACPTIAAVHGVAVAGGAGLVAACDFAVAERGSSIGFPETRRGLTGAYVGALLARQLRPRDVKELILVGEMIGAERAYEIGLVNRLAHQGEALTEALSLAAQIRKGAPEATALSKALIDALHAPSFEESWELSQEYHLEGRHSKEAAEGAKAFLEKRKPYWDAL